MHTQLCPISCLLFIYYNVLRIVSVQLDVHENLFDLHNEEMVFKTQQGSPSSYLKGHPSRNGAGVSVSQVGER